MIGEYILPTVVDYYSGLEGELEGNFFWEFHYNIIRMYIYVYDKAMQPTTVRRIAWGIEKSTAAKT